MWPTVSWTAEVPTDEREYLRAVYRQLSAGWAEVQRAAEQDYPKAHQVNNEGLWAEVALRIDGDGKPAGLRITRRSGSHLFDNSALWLMTGVKPPPLPRNQPVGRATLFWRFHRDKRGCGPMYARLQVAAFTTRELFARSLARKQWSRAERLLQQHPLDRELHTMAGDAGLASGNPAVRRMALPLASTRRIEAALGADDKGLLWADGVQILVQRKAPDALVRLLEQQMPSTVMRTRMTQERRERVVQLIHLLDKLHAALPTPLAGRIFGLREHALTLEVLAMTRDPKALIRARQSWKGDRGMVGAVAVRWAQLSGDRKAERAVRHALAGKGRKFTLAALARFPLPRLAPDVSRLARDGRVPTAQRVLALDVLAKTPGAKLTPAYTLLGSDNPALQIAAAQVLGDSPKNKRGLTYRVARLAYKSKGAVKAAALAAQARLGYDRFRSDVIRLMRTLSVEHRAIVIRSLWGYGEEAVSILANLAKSDEPAIRQAAMAALKKIPGKAASSTLDQLASGAADGATSGGTGAGAASGGGLEALVRLARQLATQA